ncbi:class I SAM-dependent methyltransferase [Mycolicibacterium sp. P9-64]|uniref:class I SAM-dependent methyltransferase n=1 Tax=Mycolicibacterium sp. P9-64 TaxID=2024612 RepID=UPI0011EFE73D|nr:class I SAM-dependent methyltransferase [Mycolicibacterium sp. P9-64]KAA0087216.1 class I SAM-dependent methyltransferase [Mycolicibacterium sp. P9-64]
MTDIARAETGTEPQANSAYAAWLQAMAVLYDPFVWLGERAGMRRRRRTVVGQAHGLVVEIGAGTGLNVAHYSAAVDELILAEPEPGMRRKLARRLDRHGRVARIVDAPAERLPFADSSVDTVVSTLVLCTVDDPEGALREIARVLRPDGQLLFIEHVRSSSRFLAACQDTLLRPWRGFAGGCVCNRPTLELMRACGFVVDADDGVWRGMPAIVHPLAVGRATHH